VAAGRAGNAFGHVGQVIVNQTLAAAASRALADRVISPQVAGLARVVGREDELSLLRAGLWAGRMPVVRILSGMGGVGKTTLARAYAQRHQGDYQVVWWVRAEDADAVDAEFRGLLEFLLPPDEAGHVRDARSAALTLLSRWQNPWLLILDNVADAEVAHSLIPGAGNGHVLITSQSAHWPTEDAVLRISALAPDGAIELLVRLSLDTDRESAEALAAELGRLPLALTQAGSFVRANGIDLATYHRLYRARSSELNADARPPDYPHTVATTWQLAIRQLSPSAAALLNLLSFYASEAIPLSFLLTGAPATIELPAAVETQLRPLLVDELTRHRAVGALHGHSLITGTGADSVTVHRLVQAVTQDRLRATPDAAAWAGAAHALLAAAMPPRDSVTAASLSTWNVLRTHVRKLVDVLPPDHAGVLATRRDQAYWTGHAGDPAAARDLLRDLLPLSERVAGAEHPATLATRHDLAYWTGHAGDPAAARDLLRDLLPVSERVLGAGHPATLTTRHDLASWTGHAGSPVAARDLARELLTTGERALGAEHPAVLAIWSTLARLTGETGDAAAARDLFSELLPVRQRVLGPEHPRTLLIESHLAYWTGRAGDPAAARDLLAALLPVRARILGAEHPVTLSSRHDAAVWTGRAGDAAGARDLLAELLPIRERILGVEHPDAVVTREALAHWDGR